jgi:S-adenosylmethionine:tRNA ribosyltransferase-isomerase
MQNNKDLQLVSYDYDLPVDLIADRPVEGRHHSRLLVYNAKTDEVIHTNFLNLHEYLDPNTTIVFNQSKVFPCRLFGTKESGGKAELFILTLIDVNGQYDSMIRSRGKKSVGDKYIFGDLSCEIAEILEDGVFRVKFNLGKKELLNFLEKQAQIPIPPYIRDGIADEKDKSDYQTIYAKELGSVAAPTAGLHFTETVFENLATKGIQKAFVTLHVGAGTFKPVTTDNILDHSMHTEFFDITSEDFEKIKGSQKVVAVGTTSLRTLESCMQNKEFSLPSSAKPWSTNIFLHPGKEVNSIDGLITNFHLPKSSLIMLVSSLIGREKTLELYNIAIKEKYRFFSYGDAMLILR